MELFKKFSSSHGTGRQWHWKPKTGSFFFYYFLVLDVKGFVYDNKSQTIAEKGASEILYKNYDVFKDIIFSNTVNQTMSFYQSKQQAQLHQTTQCWVPESTNYNRSPFFSGFSQLTSRTSRTNLDLLLGGPRCLLGRCCWSIRTVEAGCTVSPFPPVETSWRGWPTTAASLWLMLPRRKSEYCS